MEEKEKQLQFVAIEGIFPNKANKDYLMHDIDVLEESIRKNGILSPITVCFDQKNTYKGYTILSGHRRYEAAKRAGLTEVPVNIVECPKTEAEKIEAICEGNICRNSKEDIETQIKIAADLWENMDAGVRKEMTAKLKESATKANGGEIRDFRPREEFIRFKTGINISDRSLSRKLNEPTAEQLEAMANAPQASSEKKSSKKQRTFTQFCDANVVELNHMLSEDYDEELPDEIVEKIYELRELMLPYTKKYQKNI